MDAPIVLEQSIVVLCQCTPACLTPFKEEGSDDWSGCMRPEGHEPPHSLEGTGQLTYRETLARTGPRVVLRRRTADDLDWEGQCHRCHRTYRFTAESIEHVHDFDREAAAV